VLDTSSGTSARPELRMGHSAVFDPLLRTMYLFGGSKNKKWFSDIQILDIDEVKWQQVQVCFLTFDNSLLLV